MRRVNLLSGLELHLADLQNMARPLVQQPYNLRVQLIDRLPMIADVHAEDCDSGSFVWDSDAGGGVCICSCSGGAVARPGSTVSRFSGFCSGTRRNSSAAGISSRLFRPKYSRNAEVVPYVIGRPGTSARPI